MVIQLFNNMIKIKKKKTQTHKDHLILNHNFCEMRCKNTTEITVKIGRIWSLG